MDVLCLGEMGIGNTTAASAIVAILTGLPVADVTGRGTGIDEQTWAHKVAVIEQALQVNRPDPTDALDVLTKVGGLEIAVPRRTCHWRRRPARARRRGRLHCDGCRA